MNAAETLNATTDATQHARPTGNLRKRNIAPFHVDESFSTPFTQPTTLRDGLLAVCSGSPSSHFDSSRSNCPRDQMMATNATASSSPIQSSDRPSDSADPVTRKMKYARPSGNASQTYATLPYVRPRVTTLKKRRID